MNKKLRTTITIVLIIFLAGIIFYPKYKPLLVKGIKGPGNTQAPLRQQQMKLNAVGYVIVPQNMSQMINQKAPFGPMRRWISPLRLREKL